MLEESFLGLGHPPKGGLQHQGIGCMLPFFAYQYICLVFTFHNCVNVYVYAFSLILLDLLSSLCFMYVLYALESCISLRTLLQVLRREEHVRSEL